MMKPGIFVRWIGFVALLAAAPCAGQSPGALFFPSDSRVWSRASEARVVADLSCVQPAAALTAGQREKGKWKVLPYATEGWQGQALSAFRSTEAPSVRLPLDAKGWHAVYVGVCTVSGGLDRADDNALRAKLSGERIFKRMSNGLPLMKPRRDVIQETFLGVADLTGQSLDIAPMPFKPATVCYAKLVPLGDVEVAAWQRAGEQQRATRTGIATFDGHSWIWPYRPRTAEKLLENFRGFERSDFGKWWFQVCGADLVCYPSKVGNIPGEAARDFCRWEYEEYTTSLKALFAAGVNPLRVAREEAARQGAEFHVMIRPGAWKGSLPWEEVFDSRFFDEHAEWRCVDRDGTPALYMSYAVPQVRQHIRELLRETLEVQPEGVGFLFHRGMPMILWEEAFCREFREKYGEDARRVAEDDPRLLSLRAEIMTRFLTEVRSLLDEVGKRQRRTKPFTISLATFSTEEDNRRFGLDVERWVRQGLVDDLAIAFFAHHTSFGPPDMAYYRRITEGTGVGLYPFVIAWNSGKPQQLCAKVLHYYRTGATGIAVWDAIVEGHWRDGSPGNVFDVASLLGHRDLLSRWATQGVPEPLSVPLTRLGDNFYSRWFPNTGF